MEFHQSPGLIAFTILAVPILVAMVGAISGYIAQELRNRADGVVATWAGLRITPQQLVLGYHANARRIPLHGLRVNVEETGSPVRRHHNRRVHLTIEVDGAPIDRWQPYSRASRRSAHRFATTLTTMSHTVDRREHSF